MNLNAKDLLAGAIRQYQHNDCSGLTFGYDQKEVEAVVSELVQKLESRDGLSGARTLDYLNNVSIGMRYEERMGCKLWSNILFHKRL